MLYRKNDMLNFTESPSFLWVFTSQNTHKKNRFSVKFDRSFFVFVFFYV